MTGHAHASHAQKKHVHTPPAHVTAFLAAHATEAQMVAMRFNIPASVMLAQSAIESDWGRRAPGNAYFGVKGHSPTGATVNTATHEVVGGQSVAETDAFRAYQNYEEAASDYAVVLTTNRAFAGAMAHRRDPMRFVGALTRYATDPHYTDKIKSVINSNNLTQYDAK